MSKPTTGERIILGVAAGNERELRNLRTHPGCEVFRHKAAAIDAAIAEAVKVEREACAKVCERTMSAYVLRDNNAASHYAADGCQLCEIKIRERDNP